MLLGSDVSSHITARHPKYNEWIPYWEICRDVYDGTRRVKEKGTAYLPMLSSQTQSEYEAYKLRANFYGATSLAIRGLSGMLYRKPIVSRYPEVMRDYFVESNSTYSSMQELYKEISTELLINGRPSVLLDMPVDGGNPYPVIVRAEKFINWKTDNQKLVLAVIEEDYQVENPTNSYQLITMKRYRELRLDNGIYKVVVWQRPGLTDNFIKTEFIPEVAGRPLDYIPMITLNQIGLSLDIVKPPFYDLAEMNLSHYRTSADLEHGRHYTALPVPVISGQNSSSDVVFRIGSETAWELPSSDAKAYFLEFTGQGLGSLERALLEKERLMASLSSKLVEQTRSGSEAVETVRLRYTGEVATLSGIAYVCQQALDMIYTTIGVWLGYSPEEVEVKINTDFLYEKIDPAEFSILLQAFRDGAISMETFLYNLERGDVLKSGESSEEEAARLKILPKKEETVDTNNGADNNQQTGE